MVLHKCVCCSKRIEKKHPNRCSCCESVVCFGCMVKNKCKVCAVLSDDKALISEYYKEKYFENTITEGV